MGGNVKDKATENEAATKGKPEEEEEEEKELDIYESALQQLDNVAKIIDLDPGIHERLRYPQRELIVNFPVRMDDGTVRVFRGYRVQSCANPVNSILSTTKDWPYTRIMALVYGLGLGAPPSASRMGRDHDDPLYHVLSTPK